MKTRNMLIAVMTLIAVLLGCGPALAQDLRIIIMQDEKGAAARYSPLLAYLKKNGLNAGLVTAPNYSAAAKMFTNGAGDAMFSGSAVAGTLIIKELATPLVRPLSKDGKSTYHAVVVAPKGTAKFTGRADYFSGKRVIFTALASAGEFYYRSFPGIGGIKSTIIISASHGGALDALSRGAADVAIIKNLVWEKNRGSYQGLEKIQEDDGDNPEMTLMVSRKVDAKKTATLSRILLALKNDGSPEAVAVKTRLGIQGYIPTTQADFRHTLSLLKKAGVTRTFAFDVKQ